VGEKTRVVAEGTTSIGSTGKLIGSIDKLTAAEQSFVKEMVAGGKTVEIIPTTTERTADFFIDGVRYELKTISNVVNQTSAGLSKALSSTIMDARGQSGNIVIDARSQVGMTTEIAERGVNRAFSADTKTGSKIQSITVIIPEGTIYTPRLPQ
jgi:filamentous hemagglutinin